MVHYELLKLKPGTDPVEVQEKLWRSIRKLDDATDWLNHLVVHRSCQPGDDFDLMITVRIEQEERVGELMANPLAMKLEGEVKDTILERRTFDHY